MNQIVATPLLALRQACRPQPYCGIGVDIGTRGIKLAQMRRGNDGWRLSNYRVIPVGPPPGDANEGADSSLPSAIEAALQSSPKCRRLFRGRRTVCGLPMSLIEQRSLHIPLAAPNDMREMIREELSSDVDVGDVEFDYWPADRHEVEEAQSRVCVVAAPTRLARHVVRCLTDLGLDCDILDSVPTSLARAAVMAEGQPPDESVAMLDLGYSTPSLTIVQSGVPVYSRQLTGCGLQQLYGLVSCGLEISDAEASTLLTQHGFKPDPERQADLPALLQQLSMPYLQRLVFELDRTLSYVQQHFARAFPRRIWLCGGGGTIPDFDASLAAQLHQPVLAWRLPTAMQGTPCASDPAHTLLAGAMALSVLAHAS